MAQDTVDGIPESTRRAALRAVNEGAVGKAARVLSENTYGLPSDLEQALLRLHPGGLPTSPSIACAPRGRLHRG